MLPLDDLLVIDLTRVLSGPFATMQLGDLGARVIKIERPGGGDDTRGFGPPFLAGESAYFLAVNRNKESVSIDLADPRGREAVARMLARADVLVENFRPGVLDRLGLGPAQTLARNPRLVYASISGYGHAGLPSFSSRPGYDLILQGVGGVMSVTGEPDGPPLKAGLPIADLAAGLYAVIGVLTALHARGRTGRGQHVDVSMLDGLISILSYQAGLALATGVVPGRMGNAHPTIVPYQTFRARDGWLNIGCGNDALFRSFCQASGHANLAGDPRYRTNADRVRHRDALLAELGPLVAARDAADWLAALEAAGVPCGPVLDVGQALAHPQAAAREMLRTIVHPSAGEIRVTGVPVRLADTPGDLRLPPPLLGEHTDAFLREAGLSNEEIAAMRRDGVAE